MSEFVQVDVEPGPASEDGIALRFKRGGESRTVARVAYESEDGLDGTWRVAATDDEDAVSLFPARATQVEDSSDGVVWLIAGGKHGLVLDHVDTGARVREPYLVLSLRTFVD